MAYKSFNHGWFFVQVGFDRSELSQLRFDIMLCPQHKEFTFGIGLLGGYFEFCLSEPFVPQQRRNKWAKTP